MLIAFGDNYARWELHVALAAWLIGGWLLLWVGGRFVAKEPKATLGRSLAANIIAGAAGVFMGVLVGGLLGCSGILAGLLIAWLIIMGFFNSSFRKAILASLPATPVIVILSLAGLTIIKQTETEPHSYKTVCAANLHYIGRSLLMYAGDNDNRFPSNLDTLVEARLAPRKMLKCPLAGSDPESPDSDYFYLPPGEDATPESIIACDFRDNHRGEGRNVLFKIGEVRWMSEDQFQAELAKSHNAVFAKALRLKKQ